MLSSHHCLFSFLVYSLVALSSLSAFSSLQQASNGSFTSQSHERKKEMSNSSVHSILVHAKPPKNGTVPFLKSIFWEVKPFIFKNKNGEYDGIIPKMFENGDKYCSRALLPYLGNDTRFVNKTPSLMSFMLQTHDRVEFLDFYHSDFGYGEGKFKGIRRNEAVLFPVFSNEPPKGVHKDFKRFQLMEISGIAVIVPRYTISLPYKIFRGILSCKQIFIIAFLLAALFGIIVWFFERVKNKEFPQSFFQGTSHALWWSIVSMTTVGYGDIVPRSIVGRFVALCWLLIGVLMGCLMTATMTDVVSGVSDLSIHHQRVAVLENSFEAKVVSEDYRAIPVPAKSYFEALEFVRRGEVFAAMIAADVAAWYQQEIDDNNRETPLRIIQVLPANLFVNSYFTNIVPLAVKKMLECMYVQRDEIYSQPFKLYQKFCHTETLYIGDSFDLIRESMFIRVLLLLLCVLVVSGICFELAGHLCKVVKAKNDGLLPK